MKIGVGLPPRVKSTLIECPMDNTDLFAISYHQMPDIDPIVA